MLSKGKDNDNAVRIALVCMSSLRKATPWMQVAQGVGVTRLAELGTGELGACVLRGLPLLRTYRNGTIRTAYIKDGRNAPCAYNKPKRK